MSDALSDVFEFLKSDPTTMLALGGGTVGLLALSIFGSNGKKGKLATARFGGAKERKAARAEALKLMEELQAGETNECAGYIGKPRKPKDERPLYLPHLEQSVAVCGAPGFGKTFSVIDPLARSFIDQGLPLVVYDYKFEDQNPAQTAGLVYYALKAGYDVRVFAPGYACSEVCNPLDFLRNSQDTETAREIANVLNKNFKLSAISSADPFFEESADQLLEAVLVLAKNLPEMLTPQNFRAILQQMEKNADAGQLNEESMAELRGLIERSDEQLATDIPRLADIMLCRGILSLNKLPYRLEAARGKLKAWVMSSFDQLISVKESEKTVAGIISTCTIRFGRFTKQQLLAAFCGPTTIPTEIRGKQLVIFGMDRQRRSVVGPLLATTIHLLVSRNLGSRREVPLACLFDELPTLFLPQIVNWSNESRSDGYVAIYGFQNISQLEKAYGKEMARALFGACATKAIFNPQDYESAKLFSDYLGDEEVSFKQKSRNSGGGKASTTLADQDRTRRLLSPDQFLRMKRGEAILISPGYVTAKETGIPIRQKILVPESDRQEVDRARKNWPRIRQNLEKRSPQIVPTDLQLLIRQAVADALLPLPEPPEKSEKKEAPKASLKPRSPLGPKPVMQ